MKKMQRKLASVLAAAAMTLSPIGIFAADYTDEALDSNDVEVESSKTAQDYKTEVFSYAKRNAKHIPPQVQEALKEAYQSMAGKSNKDIFSNLETEYYDLEAKNSSLKDKSWIDLKVAELFEFTMVDDDGNEEIPDTSITIDFNLGTDKTAPFLLYQKASTGEWSDVPVTDLGNGDYEITVSSLSPMVILEIEEDEAGTSTTSTADTYKENGKDISSVAAITDFATTDPYVNASNNSYMIYYRDKALADQDKTDKECTAVHESGDLNFVAAYDDFATTDPYVNASNNSFMIYYHDKALDNEYGDAAESCIAEHESGDLSTVAAFDDFATADPYVNASNNSYMIYYYEKSLEDENNINTSSDSATDAAFTTVAIADFATTDPYVSASSNSYAIYNTDAALAKAKDKTPSPKKSDKADKDSSTASSKSKKKSDKKKSDKKSDSSTASADASASKDSSTDTADTADTDTASTDTAVGGITGDSTAVSDAETTDISDTAVEPTKTSDVDTAWNTNAAMLFTGMSVAAAGLLVLADKRKN